MNPKHLLRVEGLAVFAAATVLYYVLGSPLWLYLVVALAPDISMVGYTAGPRVGSLTYNAAHTYVGPLAVAGLGLWQATPVVVSVALVWAAHIGIDRTLGYGLKYPTGFGDTHLSRVSRDSDASGPDPAVRTGIGRYAGREVGRERQLEPERETLSPTPAAADGSTVRPSR